MLKPRRNYYSPSDLTFSGRRRALVLGGVGAVCALPAFGQSAYPSKPVRIVVPYGAGTATDVTARLVAERLTARWGQQVYVENAPGVGGVIGTRAYLRSPSDPHNLIAIAANHLGNAALYSDLKFDSIADLTPIVNIASAGFALVVPAASPYQTLADLVAAARANPGKLNYGSSGVGSPAQLAMAITLKQLGFTMVHIPYKTATTGLVGVVAGEVDAYFIVISAAIPQIHNGKLRALATTTPKRHPLLPDVPTLAESGMPGFDLLGWFGLMGHAGMDMRIAQKISADVMDIARDPALKERLNTLGLDWMLQGPAEFRETFIADGAKWQEMVDASGAKLSE